MSLMSPLQWPQHAGRGDLMSIWPPTATAAPTTALHAASDSRSGIGFASNCKHMRCHLTIISVSLLSSLKVHHINVLLIMNTLKTPRTTVTTKEFFLDTPCTVILSLRFNHHLTLSINVVIICTTSFKIQNLLFCRD
jgi:hypothetical protein